MTTCHVTSQSSKIDEEGDLMVIYCFYLIDIAIKKAMRPLEETREDLRTKKFTLHGIKALRRAIIQIVHSIYLSINLSQDFLSVNCTSPVVALAHLESNSILIASSAVSSKITQVFTIISWLKIINET